MWTTKLTWVKGSYNDPNLLWYIKIVLSHNNIGVRSVVGSKHAEVDQNNAMVS